MECSHRFHRDKTNPSDFAAICHQDHLAGAFNHDPIHFCHKNVGGSGTAPQGQAVRSQEDLVGGQFLQLGQRLGANRGLVIGQEVYFNGRKLLKLETTFVYCHHGFCICGAQVHWDARDVIYRRLMKHLGKDG